MKRSIRTAAGPLLLAGSATLLLGGCQSIASGPVPAVKQGSGHNEANIDGFLSTKVAPGGNSSCSSTPCTIYYQTPELGHPVEVVVNNFIVGTYPPGKLVRLGDYNSQSNIISVNGGGAADAYVNLPGDPP